MSELKDQIKVSLIAGLIIVVVGLATYGTVGLGHSMTIGGVVAAAYVCWAYWKDGLFTVV